MNSLPTRPLLAGRCLLLAGLLALVLQPAPARPVAAGPAESPTQASPLHPVADRAGGERPLAPQQGQPAQEGDWRLVGQWQTLANGDDVLSLLRDGEVIWAGSRGGGALRWTLDGQLERQFLAPQDGLPCNDVRDIIRWQGQLYLATCQGLVRYDAGRRRMIGIDTGLPSPSITALAVDDQDRLWLAMEQWWDPSGRITGKTTPGGWVGGGVAYTHDGTRWTSYSRANGLTSNNARDLVAWQGDMWVATEPQREWQPDADDPGGELAPGYWRLSGGGVAQLSGSTWTAHDSARSSDLSDSVRVLATGANALWAGTWGRGLQAYAGSGWTGYRDCDSDARCIMSDYVSSLAVGADGAVWVGTARFNERGQGLNILDSRGTPTNVDDDAWYALRETNGMPGDLIRSILPDVDGSVWMGVAELDPEGRPHGRGLARLLGDRQTIDLIRMQDRAGGGLGGLPDNDITALMRHPVTGELWVGTARDGLAVREPGGRWRRYTRENTDGGLASDAIADIAIEPGGIVWVATQQITYDGESQRWVDGGLSRFDGLAWRKLTTAEGLPSNHLSALALDGRGKLWVGSGATDRGPKEFAFRGGGLAVISTQTQSWERTYNFPTLTSDNITDLQVHDGQLLVATSYFFYIDSRPGGARMNTGGGLSILDLAAGSWQKLTAEQGLSYAVQSGLGSKLIDIRAIEVDPEGTIWLGGLSYPNGRYDPNIQPDGVVDELSGSQVTAHRFEEAGAVRALALDREGNLWAGSARDGVRVRLETGWLRQSATSGGLPSARLSALEKEGATMWVGTSGDGLIQLAPPGLSPDDDPSEVRPILQRLPNRIYLPHAFYAYQPRIIVAP